MKIKHVLFNSTYTVLNTNYKIKYNTNAKVFLENQLPKLAIPQHDKQNPVKVLKKKSCNIS